MDFKNEIHYDESREFKVSNDNLELYEEHFRYELYDRKC